MSTSLYRYAIIGTGLPWREEGHTGFGMANAHWPAFRATERVELSAICDILPERMDAFQKRHEVTTQTYTDYKAMLAEVKPDLLSICVWPHLHAEMAIAAAESGVKAIHCEKPIALSWADCKRMKAAADANGTKLTFNHQRRHILMFQAVVEAIKNGEIGDLVFIEAECGNMLDWGTHWLDMMQFYNSESPIEWVIGQIDARQEHLIFGALHEHQAICHWKWTNGVRGMMVTGEDMKIGCTHRIVGKEGVIEVLTERKYRKLGKGDAEWREIEVPQGDKNDHQRTAEDVVRQLDEPGHVSFLTIDNSIKHTEAIYATYLSSKTHSRVDLPLTYDGNALLDMVESGDIHPAKSN